MVDHWDTNITEMISRTNTRQHKEMRGTYHSSTQYHLFSARISHLK
jgi:hypothetical protein